MLRQFQFLACVLLLSVATANAQVNTSAIAGVVKDETGSVVPNAKVVPLSRPPVSSVKPQRMTLANTWSRSSARAHTGSTSLHQDFRPPSSRTLTLNIAERAVVNIVLQVGQVTEQLTVNGLTPLLEQETSSLSQVITQKTLTDFRLTAAIT